MGYEEIMRKIADTECSHREIAVYSEREYHHEEHEGHKVKSD